MWSYNVKTSLALLQKYGKSFVRFPSLHGLIFCCFCLTSCGFHPLYPSFEQGCTVESYPLKIATIPDRNGQILRNYLVDLLTPGGAPPKPKYTLEIRLQEILIDTGILRDATTNRKQVTFTATIFLRNACHKIVYNHTTSSINSFSVLSENYYADSVAENQAKREVLRILAEKIKLFVSAYLNSQSPCP